MVIGELQHFLKAHLEAPAPTRIDLALDVKTDAGEGLKRMAEGLDGLSEAIREEKPPVINVAAPHVEVHAAPSQAKVVRIERAPDGKMASATVTPE